MSTRIAWLWHTAVAMAGVISPSSASATTMPMGPTMISALRQFTTTAFSPVAARCAPALCMACAATLLVHCRSADIIVGPIGIVIADALLGEITPAMATAVCQSSATRVLIPVNHCENYIVGVPDQPIGSLVAAAVQKVKALCAGEGC